VLLAVKSGAFDPILTMRISFGTQTAEPGTNPAVLLSHVPGCWC